jgi:hypothetical protein
MSNHGIAMKVMTAVRSTTPPSFDGDIPLYPFSRFT